MTTHVTQPSDHELLEVRHCLIHGQGLRPGKSVPGMPGSPDPRACSVRTVYGPASRVGVRLIRTGRGAGRRGLGSAGSHVRCSPADPRDVSKGQQGQQLGVSTLHHLGSGAGACGQVLALGPEQKRKRVRLSTVLRAGSRGCGSDPAGTSAAGTSWSPSPRRLQQHQRGRSVRLPPRRQRRGGS